MFWSTRSNAFSSEGTASSVVTKVYTRNIIRSPTISEYSASSYCWKIWFLCSRNGLFALHMHYLQLSLSVCTNYSKHFLLEFISYAITRINSDSFSLQEIYTSTYSSATFWFGEHMWSQKGWTALPKHVHFCVSHIRLPYIPAMKSWASRNSCCNDFLK